MASEYRIASDFPHRALPLRSWPDLSRVMTSIYDYQYLIDSEIIESGAILSIITDSVNTDSSGSDSLAINSIIPRI